MANGPGGDRRFHGNKQEVPPEEEPDYFQDMTPDFKRAAKVRINLCLNWNPKEFKYKLCPSD